MAALDRAGIGPGNGDDDPADDDEGEPTGPAEGGELSDGDGVGFGSQRATGCGG